MRRYSVGASSAPSAGLCGLLDSLHPLDLLARHALYCFRECLFARSLDHVVSGVLWAGFGGLLGAWWVGVKWRGERDSDSATERRSTTPPDEDRMTRLSS